MPPIDKYIEIQDAYYKVKETILISMQQSSLGHYISPAESYYFFIPDSKTEEPKKSQETK